MKYYTFLPRFHDAIRAGTKYSTIRGKEKVKPGERFALRNWTGTAYRSPMGFLGTAVCQRVCPIAVGEHFFRLDSLVDLFHSAYASKTQWSLDELENAFARMEGFPTWFDFLEHFADRGATDENPFKGVLTIWDPKSFVEGAPR
jgi:hypothetical protein